MPERVLTLADAKELGKRRAQWRRDRIARGLCGMCGKPRGDTPRVSCKYCLRKRNEKYYRPVPDELRRRPEAKKYQPVLVDMRLAQGRSRKYAKGDSLYRQRKRDGLCIRCSKVRDDAGSTTQCSRCLKASRKRQARANRRKPKRPWRPHGNSLASRKLREDRANRDAGNSSNS
jgi:hypothetical protein